MEEESKGEFLFVPSQSCHEDLRLKWLPFASLLRLICFAVWWAGLRVTSLLLPSWKPCRPHRLIAGRPIAVGRRALSRARRVQRERAACTTAAEKKTGAGNW